MVKKGRGTGKIEKEIGRVKRKNKIEEHDTNMKGNKEKVTKSVKNMNRDELIHYATSVAQHSNKTLREYSKADKSHFYTPGKLLEIAERFEIKTKGNRVSRSFKKLSDNQLRDFIIEARQTYTGKGVKAATEQFNRSKNNTIEMLKTRFEGTDIDKIKSLSDEDFMDLYARLNLHRTSDAKSYNSNEIIVEFLKDYKALNESKEDEYALAFQKQQESNERLNRNKAINRNRGRKR